MANVLIMVNMVTIFLYDCEHVYGNTVTMFKEVLFIELLWRKEIFYLTMHSTHFIYVYTASDIW